MCDCKEKCQTCQCLEKEKKIKELLKIIDSEPMYPEFQRLKSELEELLSDSYA